MAAVPHKFDNNRLMKEGKVALDVVDKAYLESQHGKYFLSHVSMDRRSGIGRNFVEAHSVADAVERVSNFAKKRKLKVLRLRIIGHGNVGLMFMGGNVTEEAGKFIKFENGTLINGKPLSKLSFAMASNGWVELRGCSIMEGYKVPSAFEVLEKKIKNILDVKQPPMHKGAAMIRAMAKLIGKPVRAADDDQNAAGSLERWRGTPYEATLAGSVYELTGEL